MTNKERNRKYYEANREAILEQQKKYREANREAILEKQKRYWEANREQELEKKKKYREANREAILEKQKRYDEANRETRAEKQKRYYEANPDKMKEKARKERHKRRAAYHEDYSWPQVYAEWKGTCVVCAEPVSWTDASVEHIIPISRGGCDTSQNVGPSHLSCNLKISAKVKRVADIPRVKIDPLAGAQLQSGTL
jgi:5-methylcytosine-specific restriction endonuclease McrA